MTKDEVAAEFLTLQSTYTDLKDEQPALKAHPVVFAKHEANLQRLHARLEVVRQLLEELQAARDE